MIKVGVIGGAGYTAGELLRILIYHPKVIIDFVQSKSQSGKKISEIHMDLAGEFDTCFVSDINAEVNVIFICSGHGYTKSFLNESKIPDRVKIIDLSRDFRLRGSASGFIYGLPELNRAEISECSRLANPGCFATAIQLGLLPLAKNNLLTDELHVHALTGSTGAGQQPSRTTHYSWRNNNISIYKAFSHQHLDEISQSLKQLQPDFNHAVNFLPIRGGFTRGIFASIYMTTDADLADVKSAYNDFYKTHPFVHVTSQDPSLKQVINTNKCFLFLRKIGNKLLIISIIDNLIKGASGQAIQNMNLMFGLPETTGLNLKGSAF